MIFSLFCADDFIGFDFLCPQAYNKHMRTTAKKKSLGILFILGAALMFALMNYFVNAAGDLPLMQKVFFRNAIASVVAFFVLLASKEKFRIHDKSCILWLFLRAAVGFIGVVLNFYAIDALPSISDASILNKLSPFFAVLFSVVLLREKPKIPEVIFLLIAFAGAMCVVNPRFDLEVLPALSGFLSGACAGFAYTCVRILGIKGERGNMTVFVFAAFSTLVSLPFMIVWYQPMTFYQTAQLLLAGVAAAGGQYFITAAYRQAPAKEIAVFDYAQVLFAAILGYFLLDQIPSELSFMGYAVILFAAFGRWLYHILGEKKQRPALSSEAPLPAEKQKPPDDA